MTAGTARTLRETARARASAGAPLSSSSIELTVECADGRDLDVRFNAPRERPVALEHAAAASLERLSAGLPEPLRGRLTVEAGEVRAWLRREDLERQLLSGAYLLASCRGVILERLASPWTGTVPAEEVDPALPLVLGPSAVLTLVSFALEVTGGHVDARGTEVPITVVDTAASPYPPQHHPFDAEGAASPERTLLADGRWQDRDESAGDAVDPLFFLLTHPARALGPLAASSHFNRRNLEVRCPRSVPEPSPAVLVDSWRARVGPRGGVVPFQAELSRTGPGGERLAVTSPLVLQLDPWEVLARVQGASGPAAPAVDEDPIEGDAYGLAPTLVTGLTLAELRSPTSP
jgi:hypothetical protein